jgi:hypothetical protein
MRGHLVALGRVMTPAKRVEPGEILAPELGSDDQSGAQWAIFQ